MNSMQQYHEHKGADIENGRCEFHGCNFVGLVKFNADYMYVCNTHRKIMAARNTWNFKQGNARYNASQIKHLRSKIAELEAAQPELDEAAEQAEFKYRLLIGK